MRKQLQSERKRVENALENQKVCSLFIILNINFFLRYFNVLLSILPNYINIIKNMRKMFE